MHPSSRDELVENLTHLREHGNNVTLLFVTVQTTSDGLIAGVDEKGSLQLHYPQGGLFDFRRVRSFLSFCRSSGLSWRKQRWGKERMYSTDLGYDPDRGAELFDCCFATVYGHSGSYAVKFMGIGWQPSNNSFKPTPESGAA